MDLTSSHLDNVEELKLVTAVSTYLSRPDGIMNISYRVSVMTAFVSGVAYKLK